MRNLNGLKRIIAIGMLTVVAANIMTGCFYIPVQLPEEYNEETYPQGDLAAYVEKFAYGENVEYLGDGYFDICSAHTDEEINEHYYMYQGRSWDQASVLYINPVKEAYINIIV